MNVVPSAIERLPDEAVDAVQRAYDLVKARRGTQRMAHRMLDDELRRLGLGPISYSSFNRWAQRVRIGSVMRPEHMDGQPAAQNDNDPWIAAAALLRSLAEATGQEAGTPAPNVIKRLAALKV